LDGSRSATRRQPGIEPGEWNALARLWHLHVRLIMSAAFGVAVTLLLLAAPLPPAARILLGWDAGAALYLTLIARMMARASVASMRKRAAINDEGAIAVLALATAAALASLAAVVAELGNPGAFHMALGVGTILLSWIFMHAIFALHYAHEFYGEGHDRQIGGLIFPGSEDPDYWDFIYYSLVVAMTAQVSDVQITSKTIRQLTTVHAVVSFFFNVAVLALAVGIVSALIQPQR
jgi:uncharacterized membrane protein